MPKVCGTETNPSFWYSPLRQFRNPLCLCTYAGKYRSLYLRQSPDCPDLEPDGIGAHAFTCQFTPDTHLQRAPFKLRSMLFDVKYDLNLKFKRLTGNGNVSILALYHLTGSFLFIYWNF